MADNTHCTDPNCPDERKYGAVHPAPTSLSSGQQGDPLVEEIKALIGAAAAGPWSWSRTYEIFTSDDLRDGKRWCLHNPESEAKGSCIDPYLVTFTESPDSLGGVSLDQTPNFALIAAAPDLLKRAAQKITTLEEIARRERVAGFRSGFVEALAIHGNTLVNDRDIPALADEAAAHYDKCLPVEWPNGYAPNSAVSQPALSEDQLK